MPFRYMTIEIVTPFKHCIYVAKYMLNEPFVLTPETHILQTNQVLLFRVCC